MNIGFWLATQFTNVLSIRNRPLLLGALVTRLAIHQELLDPSHHSLTPAGPITSLDIHFLDDMGLLHLEDGIPCFAPAGPPVPYNQRVFARKKGMGASVTREEPETSSAVPQTSPQPPHFEPQLQGSVDERLSRLETAVAELRSSMQKIQSLFAGFASTLGRPPSS